MKYEIDTSILPNVWLRWETSKDNFWVNCSTNEKQNCKPNIKFSYHDKDNILYTAGSYILAAYAKYHADIDRLEIAACTIDSTRTAKSREWKYAGQRYFIDKNKNVYDENGIFVPMCYTLSKRHYSYNFKGFLQMYHRLNYTERVIKEFHKLIGATYFTNGVGKTIDAKYPWHIHEWYIRKQKDTTKCQGKQQKLTNELTAIPLSDASELYNYKFKTTTDHFGRTYTDYHGLLYFERVNDNWSVLRVFSSCGYGDNKHIKETERFYIADNGTSRIVTPSKNGWCPTKQTMDYSGHKFVNPEEAMEKCNRIKYVLPLFKDDRKVKRCMFTALRFPEVEQLAKMGYVDVAKAIASNYTPKAYIKESFGYYNEKEKNVLKRIGMTKHQLDKHLADVQGRSYYYGSSHLIKEMRKFFEDDFIHLDNVTFNKYYDAFERILSRAGTRFAYTLDSVHVDHKRFIKNLVRIGNKNEHVYTIAFDAMYTYLRLDHDRRPEVNWYFDSASDVTRIHDALMNLQLAQDEERRAYNNLREAERRKKDEEKRKKMDKERKQYEYEDENFIIRLPIDGNEITKEGMVQRICIGNYVYRHSHAETNLFFLRKKSEPDKPFYAIEMNNDKVINQIHGFGNRWLGNNPEAIPTVVRWLRKNDIRCSEHILTCKATGYCSTNNHVPMPVVD